MDTQINIKGKYALASKIISVSVIVTQVIG